MIQAIVSEYAKLAVLRRPENKPRFGTRIDAIRLLTERRRV